MSKCCPSTCSVVTLVKPKSHCATVYSLYATASWFLYVSVILILPAATCLSTDQPSSVIVHLANGSPVRGLQRMSATGRPVVEFLGIPYAEAPIGKHRFRAPVPKRAWDRSAVLNATSLPATCYQNTDTYFEPGTFFGADMWNANTPLSEDCLHLNVWVPGMMQPTDEKSNPYHPPKMPKYPVLVWIFGGGFWSGTSTLAVYDDKILTSEEHVIVVSMNYRVSLFGFLYLGRPEAPGNVGLLDQLEALKWVHRHIARFGGDPDQVTLFGESAGAASVHMHALSPLSHPFFKRYVLQSSVATAPWALESKETVFERTLLVARSLGCHNMSKDNPETNVTLVLDCLLKSTPEELLQQEWQAFEFMDFPWTPIVDGHFLVEEPRASIQNGRFKKSEVLLGSNLDESIYFIIYFLPTVFKRQDLFSNDRFVHSDQIFDESASKLLPSYLKRNQVVKQAILFEYAPVILLMSLSHRNSQAAQTNSVIGSLTDEYKDFDPLSDAIRRQDALDKILGDFHFTCNTNDFAQRYEKMGGVLYSYYFTHRASAQTWPSWMGVLHGYEVNFVFGEPLDERRFKYTNGERALAKRFMRYFANFARTGNPNSNPDGSWMADNWPMYTKNQEYLTLSVNSSRIGHGPRMRQCAFWKQYLPRLIAATVDLGDAELRWKQQFAKWENKYIVDWKNEFEQFQRFNRYRYHDFEAEKSQQSGQYCEDF